MALPLQIIERAGNTEVQELHFAVNAQSHVLWLDVAMDQPELPAAAGTRGGPRGMKPLGDLPDRLDEHLHGHVALIDRLVKVLALDILGDQGDAALQRHEIEDLEKSGMIQGSEEPPLVAQAMHGVGFGPHIGGEHLQRNLGRHPARPVHRATVHLTVPPSTEAFVNPKSTGPGRASRLRLGSIHAGSRGFATVRED